MKKLFWEKLVELVDVCFLNILGHFKDVVLRTCDEVYGGVWAGEVREVHGGGMKRWRSQYLEKMMHTS